MCEVRADRERRPGPLTPAMLALLARMRAQPETPVVWDYSRRRDTLTLDGAAVPGVTLNGLRIRNLVVGQKHGSRQIAYRLTEPRP